MSTTVTYVPADPAKVVEVQRIRLFGTPDRTGTPVVDDGPAVVNPDLSWTFTFTTPPDGFYYTIVTVEYTDSSVVDDSNDTLQVPAPPELQVGEEWVAPWELDDPDNPYARDAAAAASRLLFGLSGRKFPGIRAVTDEYVMAAWGRTRADAFATLTEATTGQRLQRICDFAWSGRPDPRYRFDYVRLKRQPVRSITSVYMGPDFGDPADTSTYALKDRAVVEFYDGLTDEVRVTYSYGTLPPAAGRLAARSLANQLILAYAGDSACRLPDRVTSVTRQGVSYTVLDSQDFLEKGRTGIYEIDLFLKAVNPDKANKKSRVFSPDLPRARRIG